MNNLFVSTGAFRVKNVSQIIEQAEKHGISRIELSSGCEYASDLLAAPRAHRDLSYLIHNYFPPPQNPFVLNLAASDPDILELSRSHCKASIDLCLELGAPIYSVHAGFMLKLSPELLGNPEAQARLKKDAYTPYDQAYEIFLDSVKLLNSYAKARKIKFLVENNVVSPQNLKLGRSQRIALMVKPDEVDRFASDVGDSNFGFLLDVGHLNVSATAYGFQRDEFLEAVEPYVGAFHLSDNDGNYDQNLPLTEESWYLPYVKRVTRNKGEGVPVVLEAYKLEFSMIQQQVDILKQVL